MTKNRFQKQRIRALAAQLNVPYTDAKKYLQQFAAQNTTTLRTFPNTPSLVSQKNSPLLLGYTTGEYEIAPGFILQKMSENIVTVAWDGMSSATPVLYIQGGAGTGKTYFIDSIEHHGIQQNTPFLRLDGTSTGMRSSQQDRSTLLLQEMQKIVDESSQQPFAEPYVLLIDAYRAVEDMFQRSGKLQMFHDLLEIVLHEAFQRNIYTVITSQYPSSQYEMLRDTVKSTQSIVLPLNHEVEQHYGWEHQQGLGFLQGMPLKAFMPQ